MFKKLERTNHPPAGKPLMAWDGNCGFCHYWVIKWKKMTGDRVLYRPFQESHQDFPDVDLKYFRQAIRFIDLDGSIHTGPAAVFQALHRYGDTWRWVMPLYRRIGIFRFLSDRFYAFVSKNRSWIYQVTIRLFGRNPARPKYYWAAYLGLLTALVLAWFII
jgi:predicted DCC family thiol-disulfide oxidoreductase YuxK